MMAANAGLLLLDATLKGSVIIVTAFALLRLWKSGSAHMRHRVLLAALFTPAVVLAVSVLSGGAQLTPQALDANVFTHDRFDVAGKFPDIEAEPPVLQHAVVTAQPSRSNWLKIFAALWGGGVLICLARCAYRARVLFSTLRRAKPVTTSRSQYLLQHACRQLDITREVRLLASSQIPVPMAWGPPGASVLLPSSMLDASQDELRMVLLHELSHIRRCDSLAHLLTDLLCCVFWFNPLMWMAAGRLRHEKEVAADSDVLSQGIKPSTYSKCLLRMVRQARHARALQAIGTSAMWNARPLERRVCTLLDKATNHRRPRRIAVAAWAVTCIACALILTPVSTGGVLAMLSSGNASPSATTANWTHEELDQLLAPIFVNRMADSYIAGAAVAVVKDGRLVYQRGFGYRDIMAQKLVDPERTIFRIGSISKVLTGVAIMQLVDRGLINLDDDVNKHLDEFKLDHTFDEPVRVKHLLTHTAGFDQLGYGRHVSAREEVLPLGDFLRENLVRVRPPGEVSCYDTYGITLAGYLVERVSGLSFEEYLVENIFKPLDMHRSGIVVPGALRDDTAVGYEFRGEWFPQRWEFMNTDPASTVNSTVSDMARFMTMMLQGGEYEGARILSRESTQQMMKRQYTNDDRLPGYGYTFFEDTSYGIRAFSHGGSMTGFGAALYLAPEHDFGIYITYNQESGGLAQRAIGTVVDKFFEAYKEPKETLPTLDKRLNLERFTGIYARNMYNHTRSEQGGWRIRPEPLAVDESGALTFRERPLRPVGDLLFQQDDGMLVVFRRGPDGNITHMLRGQAVYERLPDDFEPPAETRQVEAIALDDEILSRYAGRYESEVGVVTLTPDQGGLKVEVVGFDEQRLVAISETEFVLVGTNSLSQVILAADGSVEQIHVATGESTVVLTPLR